MKKSIIVILGILFPTQAPAQVNVPLACRDLAIKAGYHSATLSSEQAQRAYQELELKDANNSDVKRCRRAIDARIRKALEDSAVVVQ